MLDIRRTIGALGSALIASTALHPSTTQAADRDALWKIVHDRCLPNAQKTGDPSPCVELHADLNGKAGYAILKDIKGKAHYLLIPTEPVPGVESPVLLGPNAVNWFSLAWRARRFLGQATQRTIPSDDIALAINSVEGRGQDQFHIHISCISPTTNQAISKHTADIGASWSQQKIKLDGNRYYARRVDEPDLVDFNPLQAVADGIPDAKDEMGRMTIIVVGASRQDRQGDFLVFAGKSDPEVGDRGKAEDLLDNNCDHGVE